MDFSKLYPQHLVGCFVIYLIGFPGRGQQGRPDWNNNSSHLWLKVKGPSPTTLIISLTSKKRHFKSNHLIFELFHIYICKEVKMAWLHLKENLKMNDWENLFAGKHWRKTHLRKIVARFAFCIKSLCTKSISVLGARCDWMKIKRGLVFVAFLQSSNVIPGNSCCHLHWGWFFQRLMIQIFAWKITKCIRWFHLMLTKYSPPCRFFDTNHIKK